MSKGKLPMKNYAVRFEFEYWTHGETKEQAIRISEEKLLEDLKSTSAEIIADIQVREIDENGNEIG